DGGLFANNPQLMGLLELLENENASSKEGIFLLSLGTGAGGADLKSGGNNGVSGWLASKNLIGDILTVQSKLVDEFMKTLLNSSMLKSSCYYRLQLDLPGKNLSMDNASPENLDKLEEYALNYIESNNEIFDKIVSCLTDADEHKAHIIGDESFVEECSL